jgi:hypothetical protein
MMRRETITQLTPQTDAEGKPVVTVPLCWSVDAVVHKQGALLTPSANLDVPLGAGACTLELCRVIWCGEYRSGVKASTCNNPTPLKRLYSSGPTDSGLQPKAAGAILLLLLLLLLLSVQIPFDSTVRISMDTNLCMIKENPDEGPSCTLAGRWYR